MNKTGIEYLDVVGILGLDVLEKIALSKMLVGRVGWPRDRSITVADAMTLFLINIQRGLDNLYQSRNPSW